MLNDLIGTINIKSIFKFNLKEINQALQKLDPLYQFIVKKIIFEQDPIWWYDYYSKSSYYRLRNRAFRSLALFLIATK